ncbi:MAG TPA: L,D-transpeptidase family protein [Actinomycetota bacterium]
MASGKHAPKRRFRILAVVAVVAGLLLLLAGGGAYAAYRYEMDHADRILPGVTVAGVDVGGLNRREAMRAVRAEADRLLAVRLTVTAGDQHYLLTPADLGKRAEIAAAVQTALAAGDDMSALDRFWHRFREEPVDVDVDLGYRVVGKSVDTFVAQVAEDLAVAPRDAAVDIAEDNQDIVFVKAKAGRKVPVGPATATIDAALASGEDTVRLRVQTVRPRVTEKNLGKTVVVRVALNRLDLYDGFELEKSYSVATAKPGWTTPVGNWTIWDLRENPTWYNPALDSWGASLPAVVPGGPGNPMGTRAIYIDAPGLIRIHGTTDPASIGRYASHGCIRMENAQVEDLFERIEIGQHVIIVGYRPSNATYWDTPGDADI